MRSTNILWSVALLTRTALAGPIPHQHSDTSISTYGFKDPKVFDSQGGHATCVQGYVSVPASAVGHDIQLSTPTNQSVATEILLKLLTEGSTYVSSVLGPEKVIDGTFSINAQLCLPKSSKSYHTNDNVQILTHGVGFDKSYWDVADGYSYVDAAALRGSITFLYDRLGVGLSEHPDGIQTVQLSIEAAILSQLTESLRQGKFSGKKFQKVTGVGHSFGSVTTAAAASMKPKVFDGIILTGFTNNIIGNPSFLASLDLAIARDNEPTRFLNLTNTYLVASNEIGNQFSFLRAQNYPPANLDIAEATKQTVTVGEVLTQLSVNLISPAFDGPVDIVLGEYDLPFCNGNCTVPSGQALAVQQKLYPAASASSASYIVPGAAHGINLHYTAPSAYRQMLDFVKVNGLA